MITKRSFWGIGLAFTVGFVVVVGVWALYPSDGERASVVIHEAAFDAEGSQLYLGVGSCNAAPIAQMALNGDLVEVEVTAIQGGLSQSCRDSLAIPMSNLESPPTAILDLHTGEMVEVQLIDG